MVKSLRLHASSSDDSDTLAAAFARAARGAKWQTLAACIVLGALGVPLGWFITAHRVLLVSAAIAVGGFGSGGLADRIIADERASEGPDQVLVIGFAVIRWLSVVIGTGGAIASLAWLFFKALGSSHMTWH